MLDEQGLQLMEGSDRQATEFNVRFLSRENWSQREIAQAFAVSVGTIGRIIRGGPFHQSRQAIQKICPRCENCLPANTDNFGRDKHAADGLTSLCKECRNLESRARRRSAA